MAAFSSWYISKKIGKYEEKAGGIIERIYKPNGYLWKGGNQVREASLQWTHMREYLSTLSFHRKQSDDDDGPYERMVGAETYGGLKTANAAGRISLGRN